MSKLDFVSYDGEYPCLCFGVLKVRIEGEEYSFNYSYTTEDDAKENRYPSFWSSGGRVGFDRDWNANVTDGPWVLSVYDEKIYPKKIRENLDGLIELMNENVPQGCCGGCV